MKNSIDGLRVMMAGFIIVCSLLFLFFDHRFAGVLCAGAAIGFGTRMISYELWG
jgi:hypothetical protein